MLWGSWEGRLSVVSGVASLWAQEALSVEKQAAFSKVEDRVVCASAEGRSSADGAPTAGLATGP